MQRHDGTEYLPGIFSAGPPHASQVISLMRFSSELTTWNLPVMIAQTLLVGEVVRTYPAEIRMLMRLIKRRKPNMAEIFFVLIKYVTLVAVICDVLVTETFAAKSDADCRGWAWTSSTLYFGCSSMVFAVVCWRARIIFRTSRVASYVLGAGLAGQFAVAMWTNTRVAKADALSPAGTCAPASQVNGEENASLTIKFWQSSTFWFLLYNTVFESAVMTACCLRLKATSSGPGGLTKIAKVLFVNNVHYMAGVETVNVIELVMLLGWASSLPPVHMTSIAIQIVVGLQMLIGEQEAVYAPTCSQLSYTSSGYSSSNGGTYVNKHHAGASFSTPPSSRTLSYVKRPGTAGTAVEYNVEYPPPVRKATVSSISSVPAYVKSSPGSDEGMPLQVHKANIQYKQEVRVSIDDGGAVPLPPNAPRAGAPF